MLKRIALIAMMTTTFGLMAQEPTLEQEDGALTLVEEFDEEDLSNTDLAYRQRDSRSDQTRPRYPDKCKSECSRSGCKKGERKGAARRVVEGD